MVLDKPRQPLQLRNVEKPRPAKGQLLGANRNVRGVQDRPSRRSMANCRIQNCCSYQVTKLLVVSKRSEKKQIRNLKLATVLAFRGLAGPMANAHIVDRTGKICVIERVSRATRSTAVTPTSPSPTLDSVFTCLSVMMMSRLRRCFCAGLIGYRSYRKTGDVRRLGIYGFGNAAHLIAQIALTKGVNSSCSHDRVTQRKAPKCYGCSTKQNFRLNCCWIWQLGACRGKKC